jgi:outer membrane protein
MRFISNTIIIGLLLLFSNSVLGQNLKFGHVNIQDVMTVMPEFTQMQKDLEGEYSTLEAQLATMQEDLKKMQEDYMANAKTLTAEAKAKQEKDLVERSQKVQTFYRTSQQNLSEKQQEMQAPVLRKVMDALEQVGTEGGFIYIFEAKSGATVYLSDQSVDVTPLLKKKLGIN